MTSHPQNTSTLRTRKFPIYFIDEALKTDTQVKWSFGVSDANIFNETNTLTVFNLGDGSSNVHTTNESTTVAALEKMRKLIINLAQNQKENNV